MSHKQPLHPAPGEPVRLDDFDPDYTGDLDKKEAKARTADHQARLVELQNVLFAEGKHALLIVLQGMDASGKNSTIKHVLRGINPLGVQVTSFVQPTPLELAHDFLWRVHLHVPPQGMIGVFNRSHYEDVLIVRVNELVPEQVWRRRYAHINDFERLLADSGVTILKFFLHISKEEQKEQLQERLDTPDKRWKFSRSDLPVRARWDDYMHAYSDAITECNTEWAPWYIIPANKRWFRNAAISGIIVDALEGLDLRYPEPAEDLSDVVIPD